LGAMVKKTAASKRKRCALISDIAPIPSQRAPDDEMPTPLEAWEPALRLPRPAFSH